MSDEGQTRGITARDLYTETLYAAWDVSRRYPDGPVRKQLADAEHLKDALQRLSESLGSDHGVTLRSAPLSPGKAAELLDGDHTALSAWIFDSLVPDADRAKRRRAAATANESVKLVAGAGLNQDQIDDRTMECAREVAPAPLLNDPVQPPLMNGMAVQTFLARLQKHIRNTHGVLINMNAAPSIHTKLAAQSWGDIANWVYGRQ